MSRVNISASQKQRVQFDFLNHSLNFQETHIPEQITQQIFKLIVVSKIYKEFFAALQSLQFFLFSSMSVQGDVTDGHG